MTTARFERGDRVEVRLDYLPGWHTATIQSLILDNGMAGASGKNWYSVIIDMDSGITRMVSEENIKNNGRV